MWKVDFLNSTISMFWRWWCSTFSKNVLNDSKYLLGVPKTSLNTYNIIWEHLEVIWKNHIKLQFLIIFRAGRLLTIQRKSLKIVIFHDFVKLLPSIPRWYYRYPGIGEYFFKYLEAALSLRIHFHVIWNNFKASMKECIFH